MALARTLALLLFAAPLVSAGTIDVTSAENVQLQTGDRLSFELSSWNYSADAVAFGLPADPTDVAFALITAPFTSGMLSATLASADASIFVALDNLGFTSGYYSGAGYQGAVSLLRGHFSLSSSLSQDLFEGGSVHLDFENTGGGLFLGLAPLTFSQDLFVSLSSGPMSVGAMPGAVSLIQAEPPAAPQFRLARAFAPPPDPVPEPAAKWLILGGGLLLCGFSRYLRRLSSASR